MPTINELMQWIDPSQWGFGVVDPRTLCILIGAVLVLLGSRLYRLMLLGPGFVGGVLLAHHYAPAGTNTTKMAIVIGCGLVGVLLMHLMEQTALRLVGVALMVGVATAVSPEVFGSKPPWYINYVAGAIGAVGFPMVYERALPLITSALGALMIAWALDRPTDIWMLGILSFVGVAVQTLVGSKGR
jgi:hypothetical protein